MLVNIANFTSWKTKFHKTRTSRMVLVIPGSALTTPVAIIQVPVSDYYVLLANIPAWAFFLFPDISCVGIVLGRFIILLPCTRVLCRFYSLLFSRAF